MEKNNFEIMYVKFNPQKSVDKKGNTLLFKL
jgi:hypothetical protein